MNENERIKEAFLAMLNQACGEWEPAEYERDEMTLSGWKIAKASRFLGYDSQCLSAYESALDLGVELGWIKKKDVIR